MGLMNRVKTVFDINQDRAMDCVIHESRHSGSFNLP